MQGSINPKPKNKFVSNKVTFSDPVVNRWQENVEFDKGRDFQTIKSIGRGVVLPLNRFPIFVQQERVDIVDVLHTFIMNTLVSDKVLSASEYRYEK